MGSLYRSRYMTYCQVLVPPEAVYNCVAALGEIGRVQFNDVMMSLRYKFFWYLKDRCMLLADRQFSLLMVKSCSVEKCCIARQCKKL